MYPWTLTTSLSSLFPRICEHLKWLTYNTFNRANSWGELFEKKLSEVENNVMKRGEKRFEKISRVTKVVSKLRFIKNLCGIFL